MKPAPRNGRRSIFWRWRRLFFLVGLTGLAALAGAAWVVFSIELPEAEPLLQTTYICAAEVSDGCDAGNALASLSGGQDRSSVELESVPDVLIDAVLAQEDRNFFSHSGVDPISIGRALWTDIRHQTLAQGGSTITQQYVKNVYLTDDQTLLRKLREAALAVRLERELGKEEILERYLNTIYFGRGAYGVEAAARAYFGKPVGDVDLGESAFLAGLIRAPERAEPTRDPVEATRRRHNALVRMRDDGHISAEEMAVADAVPIEELVLPRPNREGLGAVRDAEYGTEYFVDQVRQFLIAELGAATVYGGGLRVYTTLDLAQQRAAYQAITETLDPLDPESPSAALVALDHQNRVVAMVGGSDFRRSQVNLAMGTAGGGSGRGPGSAYKPFALAQALVDGRSLADVVPAEARATFPGADDGRDWVVTGGGSPSGEWSLLDAMVVSSNTAYAGLMLELGPERVNDLAQRAGISADVADVPAVVLGAGDVSVMDMAVGYSTFRDHGVRTLPVMVLRVTDSEGRVLYRAVEDRAAVIPPEVADSVTHALVQVVQRGTGRAAAVEGQHVAGKTGTTTGNRDAWFVGYTCGLTAAVWMGYPDADETGSPRDMSDFGGVAVTGGSFPARIWSRFVSTVTTGVEPCAFPQVRVQAPSTTSTTLTCPAGPAPPEGEAVPPAEDCPPVPGEDGDPDPEGGGLETEVPTEATSTTSGVPGGDESAPG